MKNKCIIVCFSTVATCISQKKRFYVSVNAYLFKLNGTKASLCFGLFSYWDRCSTNVSVPYILESFCQLQPEVGENLNHFTCQSLSPPLLHPLLVLYTWKPSPGQETSSQHLSKTPTDGEKEKKEQVISKKLHYLPRWVDNT